MSVPTCRHCNAVLGSQQEKALSGEVQWVWAAVLTDEWVCPSTGDEHCPTHLPCPGHEKIEPAPEPEDEPDYSQPWGPVIDDLRAELLDKIEDLQREVEELRDRLD